MSTNDKIKTMKVNINAYRVNPSCFYDFLCMLTYIELKDFKYNLITWFYCDLSLYSLLLKTHSQPQLWWKRDMLHRRLKFYHSYEFFCPLLVAALGDGRYQIERLQRQYEGS